MSQQLLPAVLVTACAFFSSAALAHHEAFKASDVIGKTLHDPRGAAIGEVTDLVIENDEVLNAVVSVGGTLGVGDKVVAVPARELQFSHDDNTWHIAMTKAQLEALPKFDDAHLIKTDSAARH